ncbi:MAG TPA: hypothetical protein VJ506_12105 [Candidatus Limnocylindrales bacterium]|nr:hypothetical protein [Candidatus Limnocylindrales bacterium]
MPYQGRSLDDLPLAAYSTGMVEDETTEAVEPEETAVPMDARAAALSIVEPQPSAPAPVDGSTPVHGPTPDQPAPPRASRAPLLSRLPRPALPRPGLQRPGLPRAWLSALPRDPRTAARDPRVLAGGAIVIGVVVLAAAFGRGVTSGGTGPAPSASPGAAAAARPPGTATMTLSGGIKGDYDLTGSTGFGRPPGDQLASTWTDALGTSLTMTGQASSGTRPTGPDLALTWTVVADGKALTFTSSAGECVVGMAVQPSTVKGSIICTNLRSSDGKVVITATGTYQT